MALSARLQVRQTQSLVITPQLMQAIRLLQMSGVELDRFVAGELEQNPLLDADESAGIRRRRSEPARRRRRPTRSDAAAGDSTPSPPMSFPSRSARMPDWTPAPATRGAGIGASAVRRFRDRPAAPGHRKPGSDADADDRGGRSPTRRPIGRSRWRCSSELDEAGYLTSPPAAIAARLGAAPEAVERVLRACQDLAPTGIFARSLAECLELQLAERDRLTPPMRTLLANLAASCRRRPREPRRALRRRPRGPRCS